MEVIFLRQPHKFIKKADEPLKNKIKEEVLTIKENPKIGAQLVGKKFKGLRSHHFVFVKVNFRIAYKLVGDLIIVYLSTRENFYRDLKC
ncbi:hypothetical protein CO046_01300 [Candidatus Peregrinibacteria bacterium CG_4_9_14_0_2_um_filter_53_11]|nr:MAG: hypothetical protein CO046_01300 [Candidatus Peregrinibacteria bacterium CG_4_9_14_0_2_um_filter_53_11]